MSGSTQKTQNAKNQRRGESDFFYGSGSGLAENPLMIVSSNDVGIARAAEALRMGECIGLPTETVYGLAGDGLRAASVARIFEIKQRPHFDPLILHVHPDYDLSQIVREVPLQAHRLMVEFWPGPLTLVLQRGDCVPDLVTSGLDTVAVRCPAHPVAQAVLRAFGGPLAAPSANPFGRLSPTTADAVEDELGGQLALVLDGGPCSLGIESTIVDCSSETFHLLRHGAIDRETLEPLTGPLVEATQGEKLKAPGMLASHYAPRTPLRLLEAGESSDVFWPPCTAHLSWGRPPHPKAVAGECLSLDADLREGAARLFRALRRLDHSGAREILADPLPEAGLGRAIMDRLRKASAHGV
jgi:L-threonylcarbamoyladenylate synthase